MREIKFRAWDKTTKIMSIDISLDFLRNYAQNLNECFSHFAIKTGLVVMQYTGLEDTNGKEIYEGDIIRYKDKEKSIDQIGLVSGNYEDYEGCFVMVIDGFMKGYLHEYTYDDIEVIGNVYEDPELLRSEKNDA